MLNRSFWQYCLPQISLSRLLGALADCKRPKFLIHWFIKRYIAHYQVDMSVAKAKDIESYHSFNQFFTRPLASSARPINLDNNLLLSPVDAKISQIGPIARDRLIQAKGKTFSLAALIGDNEDAKAFHDGLFTTLYLSPRDYHRVHMPCAGTLNWTRYIPGRLFSVNPQTAQDIDHLFARNERLVCHFTTSFGPMIMILVGAMIVASMNTVWHGRYQRSKKVNATHLQENITLEQGEEMGAFLLGSTVILLLPKNANAHWCDEWQADDFIEMGKPLANLT